MNQSPKHDTVQEFRAQVGAAWFDLSAFLADRRRILEDPQHMLAPAGELALSPLRFAALLWIVGPAIATAIVLALAAAIADPNPSPYAFQARAFEAMAIELRAKFGEPGPKPRERPDPERLAAVRETGTAPLGVFDEDTLAAMLSAYRRTLVAAESESTLPDFDEALAWHAATIESGRRRAAFQQRLIESGVYSTILTALGGVSIVITSLLFRRLVRRRRAEFANADVADRVFLYYLPARQFWFGIASTAASILAAIGTSYVGAAYLWAFLAAPMAVWLLTLVHVYRCGPPMAGVLSGQAATSREHGRRIANRVIVSYLLSFVVLFMFGGVLGIAIAMIGPLVG